MQRNINELNSREQALSRNENKAGVMVTEVNLLQKGKTSSTFNQFLRGPRELASQISILSSLVHTAICTFSKGVFPSIGAASGLVGGKAAKCWEQGSRSKRKILSPRGTGLHQAQAHPSPLQERVRVLGECFLQRPEKPGVGLKRKENVPAVQNPSSWAVKQTQSS